MPGTFAEVPQGSPQRFTGHPIAVLVQVGVPLSQQLLGPCIAADLPAGQLLAAVTASRGRWRSRGGGSLAGASGAVAPIPRPWIDRSGLPPIPEPEETLPWLPPDYLAGVLLNQWRFDEHVPIKGDRDRWEQLLLAGRPEEAMEVALHRLRVTDVVSWAWPAIAASDPERLLRAVEVPVHPRTLGRAKAGG